MKWTRRTRERRPNQKISKQKHFEKLCKQTKELRDN